MSHIWTHALQGIVAIFVSALCLVPAYAGESQSSINCTSRYLNIIGSLHDKTRLLENTAGNRHIYRIRNTVTYEHLYYGKGGKLLKNLSRKVYLGTGFAYMKKDGEYFVATNQHVAQMPEITVDSTSVEGVPAGARKIKEVLEIIQNKRSKLPKKRIPLTLVVADEETDTAILKTSTPLEIMPYKMGDSSAVAVGNVVIVRGYPLGVFPSTNAGRVTAIGILDSDETWNHVDFVTDAQLSDGNSGSPLFAISCETGELELVGIYHAEYREGKGMGLVVGINDVRELLETLSVPAKKITASISQLSPLEIANIVRAMPAPVFIPFAERVVRIDIRGDLVRFAILPENFPLETAEKLVLVSGTADQGITSLLFPEQQEKTEILPKQMNPSFRDQIEQLARALWRQAGIVIQYRQASLSSQETDSARTRWRLGEHIKLARREQSTLLEAIDFDSVAIPDSAGR